MVQNNRKWTAAGPWPGAEAGGLRTARPEKRGHLPSRAESQEQLSLSEHPRSLGSPIFIKVLTREISSEIEIEV
jgi:hypothetical protein